MQLSGLNLFFLSLPRHDARYTSTPWQIASALASQNKVIFLDNPFTFTDAILQFRNPAVRKRVKAYFGKETFQKEGVDVIISPFVWPVNFLPKGKLYNFFSAWNNRMMAGRVNRYLRKNNISSLVYVNSFNFYFADLYQHLRTKIKLNVYHCIDPMVKAFTLKHGLYLQERAAKKADIIISTAPALQQEFISKGYTKSYLVPNAANFKLFSTALEPIAPHEKVAQIKGKVLGYLGNIERRTDFNLLLEAIEQLPDWTLVMAGPVELKYVPDAFMNHPRIKLVGSVSHTEAPAMIKRFDVAMIPFKPDDVSKGIYPLKLYEYLAAGKPVVSTNFNPDVLSELKPVVHVGENPTEFAGHVLKAYATDSEAKQKERVQVASQNTWEDRVEKFGKFIAQELVVKENMAATQNQNPSGKGGLKDRIKSNPRLKKFVLWLIFRPKPNGSRVRWFIWLWLIFPKYFRAGVSWRARLDLVPFNKYKLGKYSRVEMNVVINNGMGDVIIHDEVHTGIGCVIIGPVTLHKHVGLSQYVRILGMHHGSDADSPHHHQPVWKAPVILEEDAWIGTGTVIMGKKNGEPLTLGRYCRIGANSVVMDDIPAYSVAVGSPAKVVRVWDFENRCWVRPDGKKHVEKSAEIIDVPEVPKVEGVKAKV
jgi:teichuronic acid biosynthesis glycosyltransferase TuaH